MGKNTKTKDEKLEINLINFKFVWQGKDFDKIAPNVLKLAQKLVECNLIYVEEELNESGNVVIHHPGVCKREGLVQSLASGLVKENPYSYTFSSDLKNSLNCICKGRDESKGSFCKLPSCPIFAAGYLWYLKNRDNSDYQEIEEINENVTENDIYNRNYNELKKMGLDEEIEEFLEPLLLPNIKGLRCAFIGEEGTDKERIIGKISNWLYRVGKINAKNYYNIKLSEVSDTMGENSLYVINEIDDYLDTINNNDSFSESANAGRKYAIKSIKNLVRQTKGKYIIINTTPLELKKLFAVNAKLAYIFDQAIYFKDYKDEEILQFFEEELPEYHRGLLEEEFKNTFLGYLQRNRKYFPFKNRDLSVFLAGYVSRKKEIILPKERYDGRTLENMFENFIGMKNIKNQLRELNNFLMLKNQLEKLNIKFPDFNLHMMFLGNPGTGKTTVARMIAKTLFDLGYIKENKCIEVEAKDLIAAYSGQTPLKTNRVITSALGGVLFIDEAYSLTNSVGSSGAEAIATLIKAMEDNKGELVVIFAGYTKEMQEFIRSNSGIKSRIGYTFEFADYTSEELYYIFELKMKKTNFSINEDGKKGIIELINFGRKKKNFGNGRYIDNILQKTFTKHASLKLEQEDVLKLTKDSIPTIEEILTYSSGEKNSQRIEELFNDIVGMDKLKEQLISLGKYIEFKKKVSKTDNKRLPDMNLHMMFLGNPGTGKTTIARKVTEMLYNLDCIRINKLVEVDRKDLVDTYMGASAPKTEKVIEGALGGVLFIDEAYSLKLGENDRCGAEAIATLVKAMEDLKDELVVIFAGYSKEMQEFIQANSGIKSRIGYTLEFADYSPDELNGILNVKLEKIGFSISEDAKNNVMELIKFGRNRKNFGNGRFIDNILANMLRKHACNYNDEHMFIINKDNIPTIEEIMYQASGERKPEIINELFDDLIGMEDIKQQVVALGKYIEFRNKISKTAQKALPDMNLHMLFNGDAGTGKTTMARKITEMLYHIGCIRINKLVEVERKDLVAEYIGQTAPKTEKVIEGALGGVLFIDEAYSLTPGDSFRDFGQEAIATLIKAMEDHKDELVVIFAGYTKEMKHFVNSNSGIASRIGYTFEFKNYSDEELYKIFELKCRKYSLKITEDIKSKIMEILKYFSSVENFGNGRFVDKMLQGILIRHSQNEQIDENLDTILINDILSIKDMVEITFSNKENLVLPSDVTDEHRRAIAIHEIGHALIQYLFTKETDLKVITVVPEGTGALGYVLHNIPKSKVLYSKKDYLNKIKVYLGGRAAEELLLNEVYSGCISDLEKATNVAARVVKEFGMSDALGLVNTENSKISEETLRKIDEEKKKILDVCYEETLKMLEENRAMFDKVLDYLMNRGTITGEEFTKLIES